MWCWVADPGHETKSQSVPALAGIKFTEAISLYNNVQQLWTELKDGLALKLLASLQQAAGLSPQFGLLALPSELKLKILSHLQVTTAVFTVLQ